MKKKWLAVGALVTGFALVAASCGEKKDTATPAADTGSGAKTDTIKAAWIYIGPADDGGWTQAHDAGRKAVEAALGDKVKTTIKENIPEDGAEAGQVIEDLIKDGNKIIFATSFNYGKAMAEAAKAHPDVYFEHATGADTSSNLAVYYGAGEDSNYLAGMAAGAATKSGKIGFVAPFPIPEVIRHINAYTLGAQATNPSATVKVVWIKSWFDPPTEKSAAQSLIAAGADVIASGGDSPAPGEAAKEAGVKWTGYDSDQSANFPDIWLTAAVYDWGPYYTERVKAALDGTWKTGSYYGGLKDGFTTIAPFGKSVSEETKTKIEEKRKGLVDGSFYEFTGPLKDQSGAVKVPDGTKLGLSDILGMDWFVQGVEGDPTGGS